MPRWPAPKVTAGMPWWASQLASRPPSETRSCGRQAESRRARGGEGDRLALRVETERVVLQAAVNATCAAAPVELGSPGAAAVEGAAVGLDDARHEALVVAARLALDADVVGDDVGGPADAAAVGAGRCCRRWRCPRRRRGGGCGRTSRGAARRRARAAATSGAEMPCSGCSAGVRRLAGDLDLPARRADGADGEHRRPRSRRR